MKVARKIILWLSVFIAVGFLISGFSVGVDPRVSMNLVLISMTFPIWIIAMLLISFAAAVCRCKKSMMLLLVVWIIGGYNVCSYSPFNLRKSAKEDETTFKLMTFNVWSFDFDQDEMQLDYNPTLSSIINSGADIVAIQEALPLNRPHPARKITSAQCDSIAEIYKYYFYNTDKCALLSKYPFTFLDLPYVPNGSAQFYGYRIDIEGESVDLYNIHLQSFRLNADERKVYYDITDGEVSKQILSEAKNDIIPKVKEALKSHAYEAELLVEDINQVSPHGKVIVCGDFNDVPGSYPIKILCRDCDLRDAFRDGGFGLTHTYHVSRFYFNIDHILYRGFKRPLYTKRLKVPASDHYPLISEFSLTE